jgi:hypothetical protein
MSAPSSTFTIAADALSTGTSVFTAVTPTDIAVTRFINAPEMSEFNYAGDIVLLGDLTDTSTEILRIGQDGSISAYNQVTSAYDKGAPGLVLSPAVGGRLNWVNQQVAPGPYETVNFNSDTQVDLTTLYKFYNMGGSSSVTVTFSNQYVAIPDGAWMLFGQTGGPEVNMRFASVNPPSGFLAQMSGRGAIVVAVYTAANTSWNLYGDLEIDPSTLGNFANDITVHGVTVGIGAGADGTNTLLGGNALIANTTGSNLVAIGVNSLYSNTTGTQNTMVGFGTGVTITTGSQNTGLGCGALAGVVAGNNNVGVGSLALAGVADATFSDCVAVGFESQQNAQSGQANISMGSLSLNLILSGSNNVALGLSAMQQNQSGSSSVAIGTSSLGAGTGFDRCIAIGFQSLVNNSGSDNIAIGDTALQQNTTAVGNVAIGSSTLMFSTGGWNVGIGYNSLSSNGTGINNVAVGYKTLTGCSAGVGNTALGYQAGWTNTSGSNNTYIGNLAVANTVTESNQFVLGNSSVTTLRCAVSTITALSDARDKTNVEDMTLGLSFIESLRPKTFTWNTRDGAKVGLLDEGFIAQDLQSVQESFGVSDWLQLVDASDPDRLQASYARLLPVMVRAIQDLSNQIKDLKVALALK